MEMKIAYKGQKKFTITNRGHQILVDQLLEEDGTDKGMTPPELFIASLATCMGTYIIKHCNNIGINSSGMLLSVNWEKASNPARIGNIRVDINLPKMEAGDDKKAIIKVAELCLVHNTIQNPPKININLVE